MKFTSTYSLGSDNSNGGTVTTTDDAVWHNYLPANPSNCTKEEEAVSVDCNLNNCWRRCCCEDVVGTGFLVVDRRRRFGINLSAQKIMANFL